MILDSRASPSCSLGTRSWSICDTAKSNAQSPKREATSPQASACMPAGCARALDRTRVSAREPHCKPMLHAPAFSSPAPGHYLKCSAAALGSLFECLPAGPSHSGMPTVSYSRDF